MPYPKYCLECDEKYLPSGRYARYCPSCIKKRRKLAIKKTTRTKLNLLDRSILNDANNKHIKPNKVEQEALIEELRLYENLFEVKQ